MILYLEHAGAQAPAPPRGASPPRLVWRDLDGRPAATGGIDGESAWMDVPGVGVFRFYEQEDRVWVYPADGVDELTLDDAFRRVVMPMALQARGTQVLHASAVATARGVVAFTAVSGTGKSTTALALSRRGYPLWADDAVAFAPTEEGVEAIPLPFSLRLRPMTVEHFHWDEPSTVTTPSAAPLAAVVVLERADTTRVERMQRDVMPFLLDHAYAFDFERDTQKRQMVESYLELIARVPVYRVGLTDGLETLAPVLDELEQTVLA